MSSESQTYSQCLAPRERSSECKFNHKILRYRFLNIFHMFMYETDIFLLGPLLHRHNFCEIYTKHEHALLSVKIAKQKKN